LNPGGRDPGPRGLQGCLLLALAKQRVQPDATIAQTIGLAKARLAAPADGDLGRDWADDLLAEVLLREASGSGEPGARTGGMVRSP